MVRSPRLVVVFLRALVAIGAASACSSEAPKRPPYAISGVPSAPLPTGGLVEGGVDAGDAGEAASDAGACNSLALTGTLVDRAAVPGDPPASSGGVVVDGEYDLALYQVYVGVGGVGGPTGVTARSTLRIAAGTIEQVLETGGNTPAVTVRSKSTYNATAATFGTTELCPNVGGGAQRQYTANDNSFVLTDPVTKEAFTFTRR